MRSVRQHKDVAAMHNLLQGRPAHHVAFNTFVAHQGDVQSYTCALLMPHKVPTYGACHHKRIMHRRRICNPVTCSSVIRCRLPEQPQICWATHVSPTHVSCLSCQLAGTSCHLCAACAHASPVCMRPYASSHMCAPNLGSAYLMELLGMRTTVLQIACVMMTSFVHCAQEGVIQ